MATQKTRGKTVAHGKERIQQLAEMFPGIPPRQVMLTDLNRAGIAPNETSRQLGRWALPDAPGYFEYNRDDAHKAGDKAEAYYLNPTSGYLADGASFQYMLDSRSPYDVRYEERGRYRLYRDGEALEEVYFTPKPQWYDEKTSSGKPMPSIICQGSESSLKLAALTYCEYGKDAGTCRYCNINASEASVRESGLVRQMAKRDQDVYETMLAACQEIRQRSMVLSGGVILDSSREADLYARLVKVAKRALKDVGYDIPLSVVCQAMEAEDQMKIKEAGASRVKHNLEVWDPKLFEWLCPGKANVVGRERWMERLLSAVEVFGRGNVSSTLIQGLELIQPHGFKTEDEAAASYLEGMEWMFSHGVVNMGYAMRGAPGTEFAGMQTGRTEYHLRLLQARVAMCKKYDLPHMFVF